MLQRLRPPEKSAAVTVEDALLAAEAQADRRAFAAIYDRHFAGVYGYCYRELGSAERAEDAVQQVFEQALASLPRYREAGKFRSWLYAIAHHVIQGQRAAERANAPLESAGDLSDPARSPEEQALSALEQRALRDAITRLPGDQRRVIELRVAGLKGREIATELNRSHEAVRMLQQRAMERLATGEEQWQFQTAGGTPATVAIVDGVVYQATFEGDANALYAIDAATGEERWRFASETGDAVWLPVVHDGVAYAGSDDGNLYALNAADGTERWRFTTGDSVNASLTLAGDILYTAGQDRNLYALDAASGDELWRFPLDGGVAYVGTNFGTLYAIGGDGNTATPAAVPAGAATPAAADATPGARDRSGAPGEFLWRTEGGSEPLNEVTSLAFAPDGNLWIPDNGNHQFQIFAPDGTHLETWGEAGSEDGQFDLTRPDGEGLSSLAFAPDGGFYVADSQNSRVQQFDAERNFVRILGGRGAGDGAFIEPIDVDVDAEGNVYVIDSRRDDVQVFDSEGTFLRKFAGHGSADGQIDYAAWGSFDAEGRIFVAQGWRGNGIHVFDAEGQYLMTVTGDDMGGTRCGGYSFPGRYVPKLQRFPSRSLAVYSREP